MPEGKRADVKHANYMLMPPGSVIVADRGYIDFKMLYRWMKEKITFVMKLKDPIKYEQVEEFPLPVDRNFLQRAQRTLKNQVFLRDN